MQRFDDARSIIELLVLVSASILAFACIIMFAPKKGDVIVYDCSIAEISPDFPLEVRDQCRKLRAEKY
jgi:hypothetical protein